MKIKAMWLGASVLTLAWCDVASAQSAPAPATTTDKSGQTTVQEVVITAERRTTNLQKTPIAATVLSGTDLLKNGVMTIDQLQFISPSLAVDNFGQGNDVDIRGIGKGEHNTQTGTGVITYRDGVASFPGYIQEEPYFDIANVEVLRGPQGTFAGQNATGGAIEVLTNNPVIGGGHDGYLFAHYGNYDDTGLQGAVNLPISDTLAARVAFNAEYHDTWYKISGPWSGDPSTRWLSGRLSLLWTPDAKTTVLWKTDVDYLNNGGYFGDPITTAGTHNLFTFANNYPTYAADGFVRSILKVDHTLDSGVTFRSITSAATGRTAWRGDIDGTALAVPNYSIDEAVDETAISQEFNLISPNTGRLTWVLGAFAQSNVYNFPYGQFQIGVPHGGIDETLFGVNRTWNAAIFGQLGYQITDKLQLQVGLRYTDWYTLNRVTYQVPEFIAFGYSFYQNEDERGSNVTGKATLNWNIDENNFAYAFVATGAKPGGLNTALYFFGGYVPPPFGQEYVTDYEVGWKSTMMDGHLRTQLGAYYNDFQHFQVIVPIPNIPTQATEANVPGHTKLYGLEASAQAVFGNLSWSVNLGLEHSELGTFYSEDPRLPAAGTCNPTTGPATVECVNLAGHPQTYAPEFTFNTQVQYVFHLTDGDTLTPAASYSHISSQWGTLYDNRAAGDYLTPRDIANLTLAWKHNDWTATLYGYNVNNEHYVSALLSPIRIAGAPRIFGISLMKTF
jgi:iron complex outermembrane receptor protein